MTRDSISLNLTGMGAFLSRSMILTLIPLYGLQVGFSATEMGVLVAAYSTAPTLFALPLGRWADIWGPRRMLMLGGILTAAAGVVYILFAANYWLVLANQLLAGTGRTLSWIAAQSLVTQLRDPRKDHQIGIFSMYTSLGAVLGPLVAGFSMDLVHYSFTFLVFTLWGVVMFGLAWVLEDPPLVEETTTPAGLHSYDAAIEERPTAANLMRNPAIQVTLSFSSIIMFTSTMRQSFFPIYLESIAYSSTMIGILVGLSSLFSTLVRPLTGWLTGRFGWTITIFLSIGTALLGMAAVPLFVSWLPMILLVALNGVGTGINQPLGLLLLGDATPRSARGAVMGLRTGFNGMAMALAPLILGVMTDAWSLAGAFYFCGIALGLLSFHPLYKAKELERGFHKQV